MRDSGYETAEVASLAGSQATGDRPSSAGSVGSGQAKASSKSVGPRRLLEVVEEVYKSFNPAKVTLDTHVDDCLTQLQLSSSYDEIFVRQVVYGIVRYRSFLGCIMDSFYHYNGGIALREDMDMYKIFGYLTIFRLKELGHTNLKRLVDAKEPQKMVVFFKYLLNPTYLHTALRDDWLKLYDKQFVDDIISRLETATSEMSQVLDALDDKVYFTRRRGDGRSVSMSGSAMDLTMSMKQASRLGAKGEPQAMTTMAQPFNLSQPRPKVTHIDVPPSAPVTARPAPKTRPGLTKEQIALEETKRANRKRQEEQYAGTGTFKLRTTERPTSLERIRTEIEADLKRQLTFKPPKPAPAPPAPAAQVRMNAAAVLREDALYRKKQAEEAAMLQNYEAELRDARSFKTWQQQMLAKDEATRQSEVEARRLAMVAVADAVARARAAQESANLELGSALKAQAREATAQLEAEREADLRSKQNLRAQVAEARAGVAAAAERLAAEKRSAAEEERRRQAADAKSLMEAQLRENAEKRDIIMQLRALERVPRQRVYAFDPTDMPDHGLLDSMPLVELRERLLVAKRHARDEEERRRASNLAARQQKEMTLVTKAQNILRIRKVAALQATKRRTGRKDLEHAKELVDTAGHEGSVLELTAKLDARRAALAAERARMAADTKKIRFEQMQQAAGAAEVEANKFQELRSGAAREARQRQATRLAEASVYEATRAKAQQVRMQVVKSKARDKADFLREYEERLKAETQQVMQASNTERLQRKLKVSASQKQEQQLRELRRSISYVPSLAGGTKPLQARLAALAQGFAECDMLPA